MIGNRVYFLNVVSAETFGFSVLSVYLEYDGAATSSFRHVLEEDRRYLRERPAHLGTDSTCLTFSKTKYSQTLIV